MINKAIIQKLRVLYKAALSDFNRDKKSTLDVEIQRMIRAICINIRNKAPIRFLMSCIAAKIDKPSIDIRKPYTQIEGDDSFSGRHYDEHIIQEIITQFSLPCNPTTAYLTPAFRNRNETMTPTLKLEGRPAEIYQYSLDILDSIYTNKITAEKVLIEIYRNLIELRIGNERRINELISALKTTEDAQPLSSEQILILLQQHISIGNASRLPTLIVAAAYKVVEDLIHETAKTLNSHNAADKQTGAYGDVEIYIATEENIVTSYEMKDKRVTNNDIDIAIQKIAKHNKHIDNYIFITTAEIDSKVEEYARGLYSEIGIEFVILDCIGFIRHFLHFFHRRRTEFINEYQLLILSEPTSSVSQPLKEAFLALRAAAESH